MGTRREYPRQLPAQVSRPAMTGSVMPAEGGEANDFPKHGHSTRAKRRLNPRGFGTPNGMPPWQGKISDSRPAPGRANQPPPEAQRRNRRRRPSATNPRTVRTGTQ